jgi:pyruvate kinase
MNQNEIVETLEQVNREKNLTHRKTKIVATVGPGSRSAEKVRELILAGANVFRLNFSHGTHAEHGEVLETIRKVSKEIGIQVAVLQDLCGPKLRITNLAADDTFLHDGETVTLSYSEGDETVQEHIYTSLVDPAKFLKQGDTVLLADGIIELQVESNNGSIVTCRIRKGGKLRSRVGIAFPDSNLDLAATTDKDLTDFAWGLEHDIDFHAISFVQTADDIYNLKNIAKEQGKSVKIVAKIELKSALKNIESILDASDGIMVARGDLGLEVPLEQLPLVQKDLIERANRQGIPVIVATQMLHSMVHSLRPTRAEVADCSNAVMDGADAVMLSEETAIGENPVESVLYLDRIARVAEQTFRFEEYRLRLRSADMATVPDAVAYAACAAAIKVNAACIIACTETGTSARLMAKYRPQQPLYAASSSQHTLRRVCLYWGVHPIYCELAKNRDEELARSLHEVQMLENLPDDARSVITGGLSVGKPGSTSVLEIRAMRSVD